MVAEALKNENIKSVTHSTIGNDFKVVRVGEKKRKDIDTLVGIGYYTEDWWANKHNDEEYIYVVPHNEHGPDYIHKDGTVDSVKGFWDYKAKYIYPIKDCFPEIDYCRKNNIPAFRLVTINYKYTIHKFNIRIIQLNDMEERIKLNPSLYKD